MKRLCHLQRVQKIAASTKAKNLINQASQLLLLFLTVVLSSTSCPGTYFVIAGDESSSKLCSISLEVLNHKMMLQATL